MFARAITAGAANVVASPARQRNYLSIQNQSTTATVYVAFDTAAVAAATAGQLTLGPAVAAGQPSVITWMDSNPNSIPWNAINVIASAAATPVTILE